MPEVAEVEHASHHEQVEVARNKFHLRQRDIGFVVVADRCHREREKDRCAQSGGGGIAHVGQFVGAGLSGVQQGDVVVAHAIEGAGYEELKLGWGGQPDRVGVVADPLVELRSDQVIVLGGGTAGALANRLGVVGPQPRLEKIRGGVRTKLTEFLHTTSPEVVRLGDAHVVEDARQQVSLEHVGRSQPQPSIVHRLEDVVRHVALGGDDLDQDDLVQ